LRRVFIGTYDHSLDPKGRVILPRKFRDELGQDMVFTKGIERCLYVFPLAGASQETADSQGRVVIPQALRDYAGLGKDVVVVGQLSRIEIWDKAEWERYVPSAQAAYSSETNAAHLAELGI
jgi:MraZ protein